MRRLLIVWLWLAIFGWIGQAQDLGAETLTTPRYSIGLYEGPGITYQKIGTLIPGQLVNIMERNRMGNWVRVSQMLDDGTISINGWVEINAMELRPKLDLFTMVTENWWTLDGDSSRIVNPDEAVLYGKPILPRINEAMRSVFLLGQANGRNSAMVTRIGDSLLNSEWYLLPMTRNDFRLGRYQYLEPDIRFFGPNMHWSIAVQKGLSTYTVFDPLYADRNCMPNESPLACEYRLYKPIAAFIMFGPNDVKIGELEDYRNNVSNIVQESLGVGVIPVLMTFSSHPNNPLYSRTLEYNVALTEIANEYSVPLLNMWLAARTLPDFGLEKDYVHLKNSGFMFINFESGIPDRSGVALLNLLSLRFMQELRLTFQIPLPQNLLPTATPTTIPSATATLPMTPTATLPSLFVTVTVAPPQTPTP